MKLNFTTYQNLAKKRRDSHKYIQLDVLEWEKQASIGFIARRILFLAMSNRKKLSMQID